MRRSSKWRSLPNRSASEAAPAPSDQPNILFLFADDQRADTIRAWGNEWIDTPNLDRLAAEGLERNYTFGSNSGAVCVPSRAMVLTGRSWMRSPNDMRGVPTLPRELEAVGYRTFITGKWYNGEEALLRSFDHGTAVYLGGMADHTQVEVQDIEDGELVRRRLGQEFSSELFADAVMAFLNEQARLEEQAPSAGEAGSDQPFFAYVRFTAPHDPRQPPSELPRTVLPPQLAAAGQLHVAAPSDRLPDPSASGPHDRVSRPGQGRVEVLVGLSFISLPAISDVCHGA